MAMQTLDRRFARFMSTLPGVESVDSLMRQCNIPTRKSADYLALNRFVIIEQKSLDVDPHLKIRSFIENHGISGLGNISLKSLVGVLNCRDDGSELKRILYDSITKNVDDILAKANKQIGDSKKTFLIPQAIGIVVVLNENAQLIEPDYFTVRAFETLRKIVPKTSELRYRHIHAVLAISEAHRIASDSDDAAAQIPTETIFSEAGNKSKVANCFVESLWKCWAEFNGSDCLECSDPVRDVVTRDPARIFPTQ